MLLSYQLSGQEFDVIFTNTESGIQSHAARNSVTLGPGYTYTPSGGNLTLEIQNPVVLGATSYTSPVDPETRTINTTYAVGTTAGGFEVNPTGNGNYSIPLELLPGVNGLAPSFSLVYSSNSGPGLAGYGWNLIGLSSVSRGPQNYYYDGTTRGIELNTGDKFYLDGQRLVPYSGTYGDPAAVYRTDIDIFTRVTPQSSSTDGPGWFKAETKTGLVYEYGNTTASKQKINGSTNNNITNWYVSKISDLFGNQINFAYIQDYYTVYPAEITYGPNTITFYYKTKYEPATAYLKGTKIQMCYLLDKITVKYNASVVKTYEFKYNYQGSYYNSYSVLNEVIEYGVGSTRFNSSAFKYLVPANVSMAQTTYNTTHQYVNYNSIMVPGDYNGDGKGDFFCIPDASKGATWTGIRVYFGDGNDNFPTYISSTTSIPKDLLKDIQPVDLNADGKDDIIFEVGPSNGSQFFYIICNGTSLSSPTLIYQHFSPTAGGFLGKRRRMTERQENDNLTYGMDFNGDGVNDIFIIQPDGTWYIKSFVNSSGTMTSSLNNLATGTNTALLNENLCGDFNGDGKAEIWSFEDTGVKIYSMTGTSLTQIYTSTWPDKKHFFNLGDFNADGKIDVFLYGYGRDQTEYDWTNWQIQLSTGTGFEGYSFTQKKSNLKDDWVRLGDMNGDGATDIMVTSFDGSWNGSYFYISSNNGTNFQSHSLPNYPVASHNFMVADYDGDGHTDFIVTDGQPTWWTGYQVYRTTGTTTTLMEKAANGLGVLALPTYSKLSQAASTVYQKGSGASYPVMDFQGPITVVSSLRMDNGKGSLNTQNYYYEGAKIHLQGKGFLGYSKMKAINMATGLETENNWDFDALYFFPKLSQTMTRKTNPATTIETVSNTWTVQVLDAPTKRIFPFIQTAVNTNSLTGHSITTNSYYDTYGNPTTIVKAFSNGPTQTTTNVYENLVSSSKWLIGRPTSTTLQYTGGGSTITRLVTRVFSSTSNNLTSETWHSGSNQQIVRGYKYNGNGTLMRDSAAANGVYRTNIYTYQTNGVRVATTKDPLSHTTTFSYDDYGRLSAKADFLNNTLTNIYDAFGRVISVSTTDGGQDSTVYKWESPSPTLKYSRYSIRKKGNDGSESKSWFDKVGREIRSDTKGFDGTWIYTSKRYNITGQLDSISEPYFSNGSALWNRYQYDNYGRTTSLNRPSGRNTTWSYSTNVITETTAGRTYTKTVSSDGTVSSATDPGGTISYTYYPDGKVKTITAPGSIVTQMQYDIAGNQTQLVDPSAGTINYTYNGFGELLTQQNARSQTTTISYYPDGRIFKKLTPDGTTKYRYNSNKQLVNVNSYGTVSHTYGYDSKGRVTSVIDTIPGTTPLTTSYTFDALGRSSTITHPSGLVETKNYNSVGYLYRIDAAGNAVWTTSSMNARGQVTAGQYGSNLSAGYGFDNYGFQTSITAGTNNTTQNFTYDFNATTGNLSWRQNNNVTNLKETFNYDNLDRLDNVYQGISNPTMTLDMDYDANKGGITTKSDVGTLLYSLTSKPYAVSHIAPVTSIVPTALDSLTFTSFESVSTIEEGIYTASFVYNPEDQRAKMEVKQNGSTLLTRWYLGSNYIKETASGVTKEYTFIGGDAYSAPVVAIKQSGTTTFYYLLRDHLGSITHVVNSSNGSTVYEYSYDAWGRMRNTSTWTDYAPGSEPALFVAGRGFTGHEHLPWFNLINMNGRVYDPLTGQFLSPDNNVQSPDFTQNFNRFTYCLNNPLKYTDITGYTWLSNFGDWLGSVGKKIVTTATAIAVGAAVACIPGLNAVGIAFVGGMLSGAASGGLGAALNGGNVFSGAILGGILGAGVGLATLGVSTAIGYGLNSTFPDFNGGGLRFFPETETLQGSLASMLPRFGSAINGVSNISIGSGILGGIFGGLSTQTLISPLMTSSSLTYNGVSLNWMNNYSDGSSTLIDSWPAISGGRNPLPENVINGRIPNGTYNISKIQFDHGGSGYCRGDVDFYAPLEPQFTLPSGRAGLQIHPEGGLYGTNGCIGIQSATEGLLRFYNKMYRYLRRSRIIRVVVNY